MRYETRDQTVWIRQVTPDELRPGDDPLDPEFRVGVSRVANGWWTRAELAALHAKIGEMLALPVPEPELVTQTVVIKLTPAQASWLEDMAQSGSEAWAEAEVSGARIDREHLELFIPPPAARAAGLAVGIRADLAASSDTDWPIGERSSWLGLARKMAKAGITNAAPL